MLFYLTIFPCNGLVLCISDTKGFANGADSNKPSKTEVVESCALTLIEKLNAIRLMINNNRCLLINIRIMF